MKPLVFFIMFIFKNPLVDFTIKLNFFFSKGLLLINNIKKKKLKIVRSMFIYTKMLEKETLRRSPTISVKKLNHSDIFTKLFTYLYTRINPINPIRSGMKTEL